MKKSIYTTKYINPNVEIIYINVEQGYSNSYGEYGEAGSNFDIEKNGDF